jgi:ADP-dependent glucokinase
MGPIGPKLRELLNSNIIISNSTLIDQDEVHVIMEYNAGEAVIMPDGQVVSTPNANRFIVTHDIYNSKMEMLDEFFASVSANEPDIVILSGLHLLESQQESIRYEYEQRAHATKHKHQ